MPKNLNLAPPTPPRLDATLDLLGDLDRRLLLAQKSLDALAADAVDFDHDADRLVFLAGLAGELRAMRADVVGHLDAGPRAPR